ncbi:MAG: formylglycine-generating enzyme family protein [Pseudomonadota bacterium]
MTATPSHAQPLSKTGQAQRKRYLAATLVTCLGLAIVGLGILAAQIGSDNISKMRHSATYNLKEEPSRIRAMGEDITIQAAYEKEKQHVEGYSVNEVADLLSNEMWKELNTVIKIPEGPFLMGTDYQRADDQDRPQHKVVLPEYYIDKYPVTNAQYAKFVVATGYRSPLHWKNGKIPQGELLRPVTMVAWDDAAAYAKWARKRLPTEAEWEKAGRGTDGRRWPWGNKMEPERLNTYYNVGSTTDVTKYPNGASPYGVMDMSGNVNEWTADDFVPYPGTDAPADLFQGKIVRPRNKKEFDIVPTRGKYKVLRGGSWKGDPFSTSLYHRHFAFYYFASNFYGFRCVSDGPVSTQSKGE